MPSQEVLLVTGSYDRDIRFWEAWSGICSRTISRSDSEGQVNRLAISPDKRLLAAAIHKKILVYQLATQQDTPQVTLEGHNANVTAVCFHAEGIWLVTASEDQSVCIWDLRTASLHRKYDTGSPVNDVVVHPNQGELISCDQNGKIKMWDLSSNSSTPSVELCPWGEVPMRSVNVSWDGIWMTAANIHGQVGLWRVEEELTRVPRVQLMHSIKAHEKYLTRALISPDGRYLATCSADSTVKIWGISSRELTLDKVLVGHQRWIWDAAFSADSAYLVTASSDHVARLWELATGETVRHYNGHHKACVCCALHDLPGVERE